MKLSNGCLEIEVSELGAELRQVRTADGLAWMSSAEPPFWPGRAPLLFPVIGKSPDGHLTIEGRSYPMAPHGLARTRCFDLVEQTDQAVSFRLQSSEETRSSFPFDFDLTVSFILEKTSVVCRAMVANRDERTMPFCIGFHPAFAWPLPLQDGREHVLRLTGLDHRRVSRLDAAGQLLAAASEADVGNEPIVLRPQLFTDGAAVLSGFQEGRAWFGVPGTAGLQIDFGGLPHLALWSQPGAPFVCIEPWQGLPVPALGSAALEEREGAVLLAPGQTSSVEFRMTFGVEDPGS